MVGQLPKMPVMFDVQSFGALHEQLRNIGITQKVIQEVTGISERTIHGIQNEPASKARNQLPFPGNLAVGRPICVAKAFLRQSVGIQSYQSAGSF